MHIDKVHPQLRKAYRWIPPIPFHNRIVLAILKWLTRLRKVKPTEGVTIIERQLENAGVRLYLPDGRSSGAGLLWIHGGGYLIGNPGLNDLDCVRMVKDMKIVVASVAYRLAPEHPFPAAIDDCFEVWQ